MKSKLIIILTLFLSVSAIKALNLKLNVSSGKNDTLTIGYYKGSVKNAYLLKKLILKNGVGEVRADSLPAGMFFIIEDKKKWDFLAEKGENITISYKRGNLYSTAKIKGSNVAIDFIQYMMFLNAQKNEVIKDPSLSATTEKKVETYIKRKIFENNDNIFRKFMQFVLPLRPVEGSEIEKFQYLRTHFFDNSNVFDPDILNTPLVEEKLNDYYALLTEHPDSICKDLDLMIQKSTPNKEVFRYILSHTMRNYLESKLMVAENVWVHLADKWYTPYATWEDQAYMERLNFQVKMRKPSLIGRAAPDFEMTVLSREDLIRAEADTAALKNVYQGTDSRLSKVITNNYTLLIFFEADCSHCKEQLPLYWNIYQKNKKIGLDAIVVHNNNTPEGKVIWCKYINEHKMYDWVNAWSPYSNVFRELYNIESTPTVLLIKNGKIELKNFDAKTLETYLEQQFKVIQSN